MHSRKTYGTIAPLLGKLGRLGTGDNGKGKYQVCIHLLQQKNSFQSRNTQKNDRSETEGKKKLL